jgi:hypothetical protein
MAFAMRPDGPYDALSIKFLRIVFSGNTPPLLAKVAGANALTARIKPLVAALVQQHLRV